MFWQRHAGPIHYIRYLGSKAEISPQVQRHWGHISWQTGKKAVALTVLIVGILKTNWYISNLPKLRLFDIFKYFPIVLPSPPFITWVGPANLLPLRSPWWHSFQREAPEEGHLQAQKWSWHGWFWFGQRGIYHFLLHVALPMFHPNFIPKLWWLNSK